MYLGIYESAASLSASQKWQEAITKNIVGGAIPGYKGTEVVFQGVAKGTVPAKTETNFGSVLKNAMVDMQEHTNYAEGNLVRSNIPTDFAIKGDGFFEIELEGRRRMYTRDGQFHLSTDNTLTNKQGRKVLGIGGPMEFTPGGGEITIRKNGAVFQGGIEVGQLAIAEIENKSQLRPVPGGFILDEKADTPRRNGTSEVIQGYYESSNVSPIAEMVKLIQVSRHYEANHRVIQNYDQALGGAIQRLSVDE